VGSNPTPLNIFGSARVLFGGGGGVVGRSRRRGRKGRGLIGWWNGGVSTSRSKREDRVATGFHRDIR
jgi:hypothetical protein